MDRVRVRVGEAPYRRGIHASMYKGRPWTIRQLAGGGDPADVNTRIKFLLDQGATGISLLFDVPTIQLYDSDEPESAGMVGVVGAPVDTVDDMVEVFAGIPIDRISVSLVSHYPSNTSVLMAMYLVMAERRGVPWSVLQGSVQNDFIMEEVVRSGVDFIPPRACFDLQVQNARCIHQLCPKWNVATFNGYNLREFGADIVLESAVALSNANDTQLRAPEVLDRLAFFWCIGSDFFQEIARLRAVREIWYNLAHSKLRCHCQTSGISLTRAEPLNNIVRSAYQALAAVLGGCQSLHVDSFDEAYSVPSEESALVSLQTQRILQVETGVMEVADAFGGSEFIENLTELMMLGITNKMLEIESQGGPIGIVESGWLRGQCLRGQQERGPQISAQGRELEVKPLRSVSKSVHRADVSVLLRGHDGALADCIEAARAGASVGQMRRAILEKFGRWQRP